MYTVLVYTILHKIDSDLSVDYMDIHVYVHVSPYRNHNSVFAMHTLKDTATVHYYNIVY